MDQNSISRKKQNSSQQDGSSLKHKFLDPHVHHLSAMGASATLSFFLPLRDFVKVAQSHQFATRHREVQKPGIKLRFLKINVVLSDPWPSFHNLNQLFAPVFSKVLEKFRDQPPWHVLLHHLHAYITVSLSCAASSSIWKELTRSCIVQVWALSWYAGVRFVFLQSVWGYVQTLVSWPRLLSHEESTEKTLQHHGVISLDFVLNLSLFEFERLSVENTWGSFLVSYGVPWGSFVFLSGLLRWQKQVRRAAQYTAQPICTLRPIHPQVSSIQLDSGAAEMLVP